MGVSIPPPHPQSAFSSCLSAPKSLPSLYENAENHNMKRCLLTGLVLIATLLSVQTTLAQNQAPVIDHSAIKVAVRGQNILFRAKVIDDAKAIDSVTLFYAVSRDAAPYKVAMTPAGAGIYMGTVSADLTAGLQQLLYYIEAKDSLGATAETPWYPVEIKSGVPSATSTPSAKNASPPEKESSWKKPALIAGGALAAGGAALAIMGGGGGSGGDSGGNGTSRRRPLQFHLPHHHHHQQQRPG
jgi:hypothetical protein